MAEEQTTAPEVQSEETTQPTNFIDTLPEDIRAESSLQNIQDVGQLAKGYVHAQRMVGADKVPIPTKNSTPDDWNAVFNKLGRPDSAEGYELQYQLQEGADITPINNFKAKAHELGLLPNQAQGLLDFYTNLEQGAMDTAQKDAELNRVENETTLRQEFGLAYDKKINQANSVFKNFFAQDMADLKLQNGTSVGNHPGFIKALIKMSENFSEDNMGAGQEESGAMTPAEADREIQKILGDPNHAYFQKNHPGHKSAVDEMFKLNNMKYGVLSG